jgi:hypothetical protein
MTEDTTSVASDLQIVPANGAWPETEARTLDGQTYDATPTHVIQAPADISAAGLRQLLRQVEAGRVIVVVTRSQANGGNGSESSVTRDWAVHQRDGKPAAETGLVLLHSLRRQADAQGLEVALVTRDERLRAQAGDVGIPVFGSVQGAQEHTWGLSPSLLDGLPPSPARDAHEAVSAQRRGLLASRFRTVKLAAGQRRPLPLLLETLLLLAVLMLAVTAISAVAAFIVPVATVRLVPAQEPLAETVTITARSDVEAANFSQRVLPARRIGQRVEVEGSVLATGTEFAPDQPAQGAVVFTNRRAEPQEIPPGTIVATATGSNVSFETVQPVTLPGGVGSQVSVPIRALEPGPAGNVRAFAINTAEGPLGVTTNVINPSGTSGGSVTEVPVVKQADKDALRAQLEQEARQKAYLALGELLREGEFVPPETVGTLVIDETFDRFTDEAADEVTLRLRMLATALAVDGAAADEMALRAMGEKIPRRSQMLSDSVRFTRGPATVETEGEAVVISFPNTASSVVVLDIDPAAVRALIRGMTPGEAVAALQSSWRLQIPPELTLGPDWVEPLLRRLDFDWLPLPVADRVPWLPFRTQVNVQLASQ